MNFVSCDFTLLEVASHDIEGYKTPFTESMSHDMIHHDDGMDQADLYQLVLFFAFCRLYCLFVTLLLTCLVACIGCDGKGCTLSGGGSLDQLKGYKTLLP